MSPNTRHTAAAEVELMLDEGHDVVELRMRDGGGITFLTVRALPTALAVEAATGWTE